jgi:sugar lactone lactonase YvrE
MNRLFCALLVILAMSTVSCSSSGSSNTDAKNLLKQPESAVRTPDDKGWLVSNKGDGKIILLPDTGKPSVWASDSKSIRGLTIVGSKLYGATDDGIAVWNLSDHKLLSIIRQERMQFLNDIVADNEGNIYASDTSANIIFKMAVTDGKVSVFAEEGIDSPNGMICDGNRLLLVSFRAHSPIQAIDLRSGKVSTVRETALNELDGFTVENSGKWLISSWVTGKVYRIDPMSKEDPEEIAGKLLGPADIALNATGTKLAIPEMNADRVKIVDLPVSPR